MKHIIYSIATISALLLTGCADAGKNQTVTANTKVLLDGSNSKHDMGGKITRYTWIQVEKEGVEEVHLFDRYTAYPSFIAPTLSATTSIRFKLVTTESYSCKNEQDSSCRHHTSSDKVKITITKSDANTTTTTSDFTLDDGIYTVAASGKISDASAKSIAGVVVTANGKTITSKTDGTYSLSGIQTTQRVVLNVTHPDYFANSRVLLANLSNAFSQNITLHKAQTIKTFSIEEGATITQSNASITFAPASRFLTSTKSSYKEDVTVKLSYYDMSTSTGKSAFPGSYEGSSATSKFPLNPHAFIDVEMTDKDGNIITLDNRDIATLSFPITSTTNGAQNIPLWSYDASSGYWLEDASTTFDNAKYTASINKQGTYGLQTQMPSAILTSCVETKAGEAIVGANIIVTSSNWSSNLAQTNASGSLTLQRVLAQENLNVTASKVINSKLITNSYAVSALTEGETRNILPCIELNDPSIVEVVEVVETNTTDTNDTRS